MSYTEKQVWPFEKAREFARGSGLKNSKEWGEYLRDNPHPNLVATCHKEYKDQGWKGWGDFLGHSNDNWAKRKGKLSFNEAKEFLKNKGIKSRKDYLKKIKEFDWHFLYTNPNKPYSKSGWKGFHDYLSYDASKRSQEIAKHFMSFPEARNFVRALGLTSGSHWRTWSRSPDRPKSIPSNPQRSYKNAGWIGWSDWLGIDTLSGPQKREAFLPFEEARNLVRSKNFSSRAEFHEWFASEKPTGIPHSPEKSYKKQGWVDTYDWLGKEKPSKKS